MFSPQPMYIVELLLPLAPLQLPIRQFSCCLLAMKRLLEVHLVMSRVLTIWYIFFPSQCSLLMRLRSASLIIYSGNSVTEWMEPSVIPIKDSLPLEILFCCSSPRGSCTFMAEISAFLTSQLTISNSTGDSRKFL